MKVITSCNKSEQTACQPTAVNHHIKFTQLLQPATNPTRWCQLTVVGKIVFFQKFNYAEIWCSACWFLCYGEENDHQITILDSPNSFSTFFLPHLAPCLLCINRPTYDLTHLDLIVGNVPNLLAIQPYNEIFFKFYPFAEFTPNDIGTVKSGLNSIVLASNNHLVLLPLN